MTVSSVLKVSSYGGEGGGGEGGGGNGGDGNRDDSVGVGLVRFLDSVIPSLLVDRLAFCALKNSGRRATDIELSGCPFEV